ncbi:M23 family metallopeptidase [Flavobacterium alkalisoli]|uniref:M23 family metallopeptidase n=2 Tax=Flavobacterium TaxID=237 RepID=A0A5B9FVF8_9FLAO|nr:MULTISPECIES: M23 family metallopeptidase [Flavobacterium]QEE48772.1 M23 family metallopeptidase [Flavobacterium alkalisoli]RYJ43927.1 putative membrane peptidase [Flavobacterium beibuense]
MSGKRRKRQLIKKKLFTKNRLVILNEDSFEEIFSLKLNLMNVFVGITVISIVMIALTTYIIAFTPLREYIPGYSSAKLKKEATDNAIKSDSLQKVLNANTAYLNSIKKVLTGDLEHTKLDRDSIIAAEHNDAVADLAPKEAELKLREEVALEDKYNLFEKSQPKVNLVLFPPAKGHITENYNAKEKHFSVDITLVNDTPVKSIAAGTVLFADWTPTKGNVIIVRHNDGIISIYKRVASLSKTQGDVVKSGEAIATAGTPPTNGGGANFEFELWKDGYPINPTQFIDFE